MGRVQHGSATTTAAVHRTIQQGQEGLRALAKRYGVNQKTVAQWKKRRSTADRKTGPTEPKSTVLSVEDEAVIVAFRKHTLLPLNDCLYALQPTIPHLTRSSLHRCLQRHAISRLPDVGGDKPVKKKFKSYPIGYFHVDIVGVQTVEGKLYLFVAIDRTSKFAFAEFHPKAGKMVAALSTAPIDQRDELSFQVLKGWTQMLASGSGVTALRSNPFAELDHQERTVRLAEAYLWLSRRFPDAFDDADRMRQVRA